MQSHASAIDIDPIQMYTTTEHILKHEESRKRSRLHTRGLCRLLVTSLLGGQISGLAEGVKSKR